MKKIESKKEKKQQKKIRVYVKSRKMAWTTTPISEELMQPYISTSALMSKES